MYFYYMSVVGYIVQDKGIKSKVKRESVLLTQ